MDISDDWILEGNLGFRIDIETYGGQWDANLLLSTRLYPGTIANTEKPHQNNSPRLQTRKSETFDPDCSFWRFSILVVSTTRASTVAGFLPVLSDIRSLNAQPRPRTSGKTRKTVYQAKSRCSRSWTPRVRFLSNHECRGFPRAALIPRNSQGHARAAHRSFWMDISNL